MALLATAGLPSKGIKLKKGVLLAAVSALKIRDPRVTAPTYWMTACCLRDDYAWRIIDLELSPIGAAGLSRASVGWDLAISCIWRMIASPKFFGVGTGAGFVGVGAAW